LTQRFYRAVLAPVAPLMSSNDVAAVITQALTRANYFVTNGTATNAVVAVVDREGFVLGVWSLRSNPGPLDVIDAITKAATAAFPEQETRWRRGRRRDWPAAHSGAVRHSDRRDATGRPGRRGRFGRANRHRTGEHDSRHGRFH